MARRPGQVIEFEAHVSGSSDNFISPAKYVRQQGVTTTETSQYKIEGTATALQEWNQQLCVDISDSLCVKKDFYLADLHRYDLMLGLTFNRDVNWKTKEVFHRESGTLLLKEWSLNLPHSLRVISPSFVG
ncbi:hypothetical protein SELMODRAFT_403106 [Selaginella moellendorffii]|uniref:Uncharacterized protein n=1 Tax=Selaginella moellendorffii TaxID=88036 RepID=D8QP25_SELML|nr:hypothetical protein SELMODRAFT_403106 [Selaginella moellendorffii]